MLNKSPTLLFLAVFFSLPFFVSSPTYAADPCDADGDGYEDQDFCGGTDCDDNDAGVTIPLSYYKDADADGYGDISRTASSCTLPSGYAENSDDCDDSDSTINPGVTEACGDSLDNNCSGVVDEDCGSGMDPCDQDGDGYEDQDFCGGTDCDDDNAAVNPAASEVCGNGVDEDCSGDDGTCPSLDTDDDGDGSYEDDDGDGDCNETSDCDCNDSDLTINPTVTEVCGDSLDNNCSGDVDEGCGSAGPCDQDGDGYEDRLLCAGDDCDDEDAAVNPAASEVCDSIDNDCDGLSDDDDASLDLSTVPAWYADNDGDRDGDPASSLQACSRPAGYVSRAGDCDDSDASINSNRRTDEVCDEVDNDCDGLIDDDDDDVTSDTTITWYADTDGDGFGDETNTTQTCEQPEGYVGLSGDCDDTESEVKPFGTETCGDFIDNDCDGSADEEEDCPIAPTECDLDADGFNDPSLCSGGTDCNDGDAAINPSASEICDVVDNDCDGLSDDLDDNLDPAGAYTWYLDADGDTFAASEALTSACLRPADNYYLNFSDCDDADPLTRPGTAEVCDDGLDNDCDGSVDEECEGEEPVDVEPVADETPSEPTEGEEEPGTDGSESEETPDSDTDNFGGGSGCSLQVSR